MEKIKNSLLLITLLIFAFGCKEVGKEDADAVALNKRDSVTTFAQLKKQLTEQGYELFDYIDPKTGDTVLMQQYFIAFLKKGPIRSQNKNEADSLQTLHLDHLGRMYELGYADISGPFGDDGDIRGITIYNTPTLAIADSLAHLDPMVQSGRLQIEMHPWWAAKGFPLR
jgi:uncharacterized protein YciI